MRPEENERARQLLLLTLAVTVGDRANSNTSKSRYTGSNECEQSTQSQVTGESENFPFLKNDTHCCRRPEECLR